MDLSIVIAYKADNGLRTKQMEWTVARYKRMFPEAELIISQSSSSTGGWTRFCKSRWINKGVQRSTKNFLLITDIDVILSKANILESMKLARKHCLVVPYDTIYKLTNGTSTRIMNLPGNVKMPHVDLIKQKKVVLGNDHPQGISVMLKENFWIAGGYDERFVGWGSEDSAFQTAVSTMCDGSLLQLSGNAYHLKHPIVKNRHASRDKNVGHIVTAYKEAKGNRELMKQIIESRGQAK